MLSNTPDINADREFQVVQNLNLYKSPACDSLVTQAAPKRHLRIHSLAQDLQADNQADKAVHVQLCEDDYSGWVAMADWPKLKPAETPYQPKTLTRAEIETKLPQVIAFTHAAMACPNQYLWGGTISPNYDCSGLMQAAFWSAGIWLPRDAYQQEAFLHPIEPYTSNSSAVQDAAQSSTIAPQPLTHTDKFQPGDLVFFGPPHKATHKATHVGLYLGEGRYIHSSGKDKGRNGIAIDSLSAEGDGISTAYFQQFRGFGRVVSSYQPGDLNRGSSTGKSEQLV